MPSPSQAGQAPNGLLNENRRGSISLMVKPETGQANFSENSSRRGSFSPFSAAAHSTKAMPSARRRACSRLSDRRVSRPALVTMRSTTTSMSCFSFLSSAGAFSMA